MLSPDFTILMVDDEEEIRDIMALHFEMEGFKILKAKGGHEALEIVKNHKVDFILSDIRMPDGDGFTLLKETVKLNPMVPAVLLITGFSEISREEVIKAGGLDLLSKPIDVDKVIEIIKSKK